MKTEYIAARRIFLKSAATLGGLAALFGLIRPAQTAEPKEVQPQPEQTNQGYRLTEHVKKYYQSARL
jgi:hypothetical protein